MKSGAGSPTFNFTLDFPLSFLILNSIAAISDSGLITLKAELFEEQREDTIDKNCNFNLCSVKEDECPLVNPDISTSDIQESVIKNDGNEIKIIKSYERKIQLQNNRKKIKKYKV